MHTLELGIQYPQRPDEHMVITKEIIHCTFDRTYPYYRNGLMFRIGRKIIYWGAYSVGHLVCQLKHGIRFNGRNYLKDLRKQKHKGFITVCNHVFRYDFICIMIALKPIMPYYPAWNMKFKDRDRKLVKLSGGIPLADDLSGSREFFKALDRHLSEGHVIHVFPEGAMWPFYQEIRPFKDGAFILAEKHKLPIVPMAFEFRNPGVMAKMFGLIEPRATLHIGDPVYADYTIINKHRRVDELRNRVRANVERLHDNEAWGTSGGRTQQ